MAIGGENVPTFAVNMKHSVESCPLFNIEVKKRLKEMLGKREDVWDRAKKHGVHVLSAWMSVLDHLVFYIVEASSQEAVEDYFKDIGFAFWNSIEIRQVIPAEDIIKTIVEKT
ncbi:MAG TPA: DUF3303 family protein [Candidatus Sulfotelmatobacter sp.]|nr:DUF3303 family protein [Candidatus Sulfotelmatobacter sp.]